MRRRQLVELEDLPWLPRAVRDGGTDWLAFMANHTRMFAAAAPHIRRAMEATGTTEVLDLCSGGGGPWLTLETAVARGGPASIELSDLYPNVAAWQRLATRSHGRLRFRNEPVDATNVPPSAAGVRTMFNAFHHFPPAIAAAILADAVRKRRAIAIFEGVNHRGAGLAAMPLQLPALWLFTPFVRPLRWSRLLLTYALPLIPALVLFDGTVSMLRLYLQDDVRDLLTTVSDWESFEWDVGFTPTGPLPFGMLHLTGVPKPI
jgi:hypothetical protein